MTEKTEGKRKLTNTEKVLIGIIVLSIILLIIFGIKLSKKMNPEVLSGDKAVCNRINTILEENPGKYSKNTVSDVLAYLINEGYLVENLSPTTSGNYYIYNASTNKFVLVDSLDENAEVIFGELAKDKIDNWAIVDTQKEFDNTENYSHYLTSAFDGDEELYIKTGVDASNCNSVKHIILNVDLKDKVTVSYNTKTCDFDNDSSTVVKTYTVE